MRVPTPLLGTLCLFACPLIAWSADGGQPTAAEFNAARDTWPDRPAVVTPANPAYADGPVQRPTTTWPPAGTPIRVPITADDWFSAYKGETTGNAGLASRWKLKGQIEYTCFDIDPAALAGKVVTGALLHVKTASPEWPFYRVGVSSMAAPWTEGTATQEYTEVPGAPCYLQAAHGERDWAYPGSTVMDVVFGRGHTTWKFADATPPDGEGWQRVAVDPTVVAARVADISTGFFVYDEVGHEWEDVDDTFTYWSNPNRFAYSKDSRFPPYLEVWVDGEDGAAPEAVSALRVDTADLPPGEALVRWITPADQGPAGVTGYQVTYRDAQGTDAAMPRYLIPMAGAEGAECRMHIQDLPFAAGQRLTLSIRAVDGAGNVGPALEREIMLSDHAAAFAIVDSGRVPFARSDDQLRVGGVGVSVVDVLDKVDPVSGAMIPAQPDGYRSANHLFSAAERKVRLGNARNETNFFQVVLEAEQAEATVSVSFPGTGIQTEVFEFAYVNQTPRGSDETVILPDPLVPLDGPVTIPSTAGEVRVPDQRFHGIVCEFYVPHDEPPGVKTGTLGISAGGETLELPIELTVWNFTLPNKLSFVPEMNSYRAGTPEVYRMAHKYRTCLNSVPYGWSCSPRSPWRMKDGKLDLDLLNAELGPLLDGSLFEDLPRAGEPVDLFYLGFNEGWPLTVPEHFTGSYWADEAFSRTYVETLQGAMADFAENADRQGWHDTLFHLFLNNKVYFRNDTTRVQAPWIFDEPRETADFWALRWYGALLYDAVQDVKGDAKIMNRCDISYSQFGRNTMWGAMEWEVFGGTNPQKLRQKADEFRLWGRSYLSAYGAANHIHNANTQAANWTLQSWVNGCDSLLNWQTRGRAKNMVEGWEQAIFIEREEGLVASVRLRAHTRGQQMIEYLTLLMDAEEIQRFQLVEGLKRVYNFEGKIHKAFETDAGRIEFATKSPVALWKLRMDLGAMVDELAPPYRRALREWEQADIDVRNRLPDIGYVPVAPEVPAKGPRIDTFRVR